MGLGYLTLSIKSEQDKYLTGNPSFTFFKSVYKKHTNFAIDYQFVNLVGDSSNSLGKKVYVEIPKNGDLLHRMYISIDLRTKDEVTLNKITPLAYSLIEYVDLFLGGQRVDRHYGTWLHIWHELNESADKQLALSEMISNHPADETSKTNKLYIPLRFWFNNNIGTALPLIALQYNDIKLEIKLADKTQVNKYCQNTTDAITVSQDLSVNINQIQVLCEFIHLDSDERRMFASNSHEYLITQLQTSLHNPINLYKSESQESYEKMHHKTQLRFNHPIKELTWVFQDSSGLIYKNNDFLYKYTNDGILSNNYWNGFRVGDDHMIGANLVLNGKDMTEELPSSFYRNVQHYQYHSGCNLKAINDINQNNNSSICPSKKYINYPKGSGIYSYSLCLSPENSQPSGSLNFSNLETAELKYRLFKKDPFYNYTVKVSTNNHYNILDLNPAFQNITTTLNDLVLLTGQSQNDENGIYRVVASNNNALVLGREAAFDTLLKNKPVLVKVTHGTNVASPSTETGNANKTFLVSIKDGLTSSVNLGAATGNEVRVQEYKDATDSPVLFDLESKTLTIYAVNYNVLRIMSGMCSVLFSS